MTTKCNFNEFYDAIMISCPELMLNIYRLLYEKVPGIKQSLIFYENKIVLSRLDESQNFLFERHNNNIFDFNKIISEKMDVSDAI